MADTEYTRELAESVEKIPARFPEKIFTDSGNERWWRMGFEAAKKQAAALVRAAALPSASLGEQREPTPVMIEAGQRALHEGAPLYNGHTVIRVWRAMLAASKGAGGGGEGVGDTVPLPFDREYVHGYLSEVLKETVGSTKDPHIGAFMAWLADQQEQSRGGEG